MRARSKDSYVQTRYSNPGFQAKDDRPEWNKRLFHFRNRVSGQNSDDSLGFEEPSGTTKVWLIVSFWNPRTSGRFKLQKFNHFSCAKANDDEAAVQGQTGDNPLVMPIFL